MNLVNELQVSAESDDVMTVLRKAKRLASKLGVDDINHWLKCEMEGYGHQEAVPAYRTIKATLVFDTNGYVPAGYNMVHKGIMRHPYNLTIDRGLFDSMSEIQAMIVAVKQYEKGIYYPLDESDVLGDLRRGLHPILADRVTFMLKLSEGQVMAIPDSVKNRVLDWACELENRRVLGENMTFNDAEKANAHTINFNISGSTIGQLNNMGKNVQSRN